MVCASTQQGWIRGDIRLWVELGIIFGKPWVISMNTNYAVIFAIIVIVVLFQNPTLKHHIVC